MLKKLSASLFAFLWFDFAYTENSEKVNTYLSKKCRLNTVKYVQIKTNKQKFIDFTRRMGYI